MKPLPPGYPVWEKQLDRLLRLAVNANGTLPKGNLTKTEVRKIYGSKAEAEFGKWFISLHLFCPEKVDRVRLLQSKGRYLNPPSTWKKEALEFYSPEKYADWLVLNKCYGWTSSIRHEHMAELYMKYADHGKIQ